MAKRDDTSVFQLQNGMWGYRFCVRVNGKNVYRRRTHDEKGFPFKSKREASKARQIAIGEAQNEMTQIEQPRAIERKTVTQVFEEFCDKGRADRAFMTKRKQDSLWENHIKEKFGKRYVDDISVQEVQDYLIQGKQGLRRFLHDASRSPLSDHP